VGSPNGILTIVEKATTFRFGPSFSNNRPKYPEEITKGEVKMIRVCQFMYWSGLESQSSGKWGTVLGDLAR
jgi:hypothetical protein